MIWTEPRGRAAGYRWPQISISRGELHKVLLAAIAERLGRDAVVTGHRLTGFEQRGDKVVARFADPSGRPVGAAAGDILIGADGIHSAVRQHFYRARRRCSTAICITAASSRPMPYLTGASMAVVGHRTHRAIIYPVDAAARWQGDDQLAGLHEDPGGRAAARSLGHRGRQAGLRSIDTRAGPIRGSTSKACLRDARRAVLQLPNVDRDPIPRWSFGRVTLIGDAAHPMQPVGAQAGSQAVVDGRVLAAALMASRDPAEALTRYQNERIAAMNDMIIRNRNLGLEVDPADRRGARAGRLRAHPRRAVAGGA